MGDSVGVDKRKNSYRRPDPRSKLEDTCRDLWLAWRLARKPGLRARFDDSPEPSSTKEHSVESCRIRIERDLSKKGGPCIGRRSIEGPGGRTEGKPKVKKVWDPWAEDEPIFGNRERRHALSRHPGTPPCGNLAVQHPDDAGDADVAERGDAATPRRARDHNASDAGGTNCVLPDALVPLARPPRVELDLGASGGWTFGLVERASRKGFETTIAERPCGTRDFLQAGRRIKALVMPHREAVLALTVRVLWVDPSPSSDGLRRAQLALVTPGPAALNRWMEIVEGARV